MKKERKNKIEILQDIEAELTDGKAHNFQQLAKKLGSHWMTIRDCCHYLKSHNIIDMIETENHQWMCFQKRTK
jgi:hypothetical protein